MSVINQEIINKFNITTFNEGDIVVSKGFAINDDCTPFRTVSKFVIRKTVKNPKSKKGFVYFNTACKDYESNNYRLATDEDYKTHERISKTITYLPNGSDDKNQHISSFDGNEKIQHIDEVEAYKSAYRMSLKNGGKWLIYQCNVCKKFHIGKNLEL